MIKFIEEFAKVKELYITTKTVNEIIEELKKQIVINKNAFLDLAKLDLEKMGETTSLERILNLLDMYKNEEVADNKEKGIILISYYGSPYITINLCMKSLLEKKNILVCIEDNMLAVNKFLVSIFNNVLEEFKICKMIELINLVKTEDINKIDKYLDNVICIGNSDTYYEYKRQGIKKLEYKTFKNMAIFCENDKFLDLQHELYNFAMINTIEAEIYEELEEFIECVKIDKSLEMIVVFTENKEVINLVKQKISNLKVYINKNPFKNEKFKL